MVKHESGLAIPAALTAGAERLAGFSQTMRRIAPLGKDQGLRAGDTLRFALPAAALVDFRSIKLNFSASTMSDNNQGYVVLPSRGVSLIDQIGVSINGVQVDMTPAAYGQLAKLLEDFAVGTQARSVRALVDHETLEKASMAGDFARLYDGAQVAVVQRASDLGSPHALGRGASLRGQLPGLVHQHGLPPGAEHRRHGQRHHRVPPRPQRRARVPAPREGDQGHGRGRCGPDVVRRGRRARQAREPALRAQPRRARGEHHRHRGQPLLRVPQRRGAARHGLPLPALHRAARRADRGGGVHADGARDRQQQQHQQGHRHAGARGHAQHEAAPRPARHPTDLVHGGRRRDRRGQGPQRLLRQRRHQPLLPARQPRREQEGALAVLRQQREPALPDGDARHLEHGVRHLRLDGSMARVNPRIQSLVDFGKAFFAAPLQLNFGTRGLDTDEAARFTSGLNSKDSTVNIMWDISGATEKVGVTPVLYTETAPTLRIGGGRQIDVYQ